MNSQNDAALLSDDDAFFDEEVQGNDDNVASLNQDDDDTPVNTVEAEDLDTRNLITGTLTYRWMESSVNPDTNGEYKVAVLIGDDSVIIITANYKTRGGWEFPHEAFTHGFYKWLAVNPIPAPVHPSFLETVETATFNNATVENTNQAAASTENLQQMTFQQLSELPVNTQPVPDITVTDARLLNLIKYIFSTQEPDIFGMVTATFGNVSLGTVEMIVQARRNIGVLLHALINRGMINVVNNTISLTFSGSDVAMNGFPESE